MSFETEKLKGTKQRPRASVYRSNVAVSVQLIDDAAGKTIVSGSTNEIKEKKTPIEKAFLLGELIAGRAKEKKVSTVIYDRNGRRYHGQIKSLAEGMRKGGIQF